VAWAALAGRYQGVARAEVLCIAAGYFNVYLSVRRVQTEYPEHLGIRRGIEPKCHKVREHFGNRRSIAARDV
jgi:hypothetical protein